MQRYLLIASSLLSWTCGVSMLEKGDCWVKFRCWWVMEVGSCDCLHFCTGVCFYIAALCSPPLFRLSVYLFNRYNWLEEPEVNGLSFPFFLLHLCLFYKQYLKCDLFQHRFVPSQTGFEGQLNCVWPVCYLLISLSCQCQLGCSDLPPHVWLALSLSLRLTGWAGLPCHSPWVMKCPLPFPALPWQFLRSNKKEGGKKKDSNVQVFLQKSFSSTLYLFRSGPLLFGKPCYHKLPLLNFRQRSHGLKKLL